MTNFELFRGTKKWFSAILQCVVNFRTFLGSKTCAKQSCESRVDCYSQISEIQCQVCAFLYQAQKLTMSWILIPDFFQRKYFWKNSIEFNSHWTVINYVRNYVLCLTKNRMAGKRFECGTVVKIGPFSCGRIKALRYLVGFYHHHHNAYK